MEVTLCEPCLRRARQRENYLLRALFLMNRPVAGGKNLGLSTRESHTHNGQLEFREDGMERDLTLGE